MKTRFLRLQQALFFSRGHGLPSTPQRPFSTGPRLRNAHLSPRQRLTARIYDSGTLRLLFLTAQFGLVYHLLSTQVIDVTSTLGPSMVPTMSAKGDWVVVLRWYRRGRDVKFGDLVAFVHPMMPGAGAIKRVVGMPGDFVVCNDDGPGRDRTEVLEMRTKETDAKTVVSRKKQSHMIQVPEGHCWVQGDNLPESRDSRVYGPLPLALIKGKVVVRVWPWEDMGWLKNNLEKVEDAV